MANIIADEDGDVVGTADAVALPEDQDALSQEDLVEALSPDTTATIDPDPQDVLPDKYKGKDIKEVVAMHQAAEKLIGTQGSEVGELRRVVDQYINAQTQAANNQAPVVEESEPIDFFEDPAGAVSRAIDTHPEVVRAKEASQQMQRTASVTQLSAKHPDMETVLSNPAFAEWVKGSPVRRELYSRADQQYDIDAADELISNFKERTAVAQATLETDKATRKAAVQKASTGGASGTGTSGSKKIYRRADIIKLMKTDPARYEAINPEIMLAYQEGRVK
jgi:hypothetical protein